jgi:molybdopterin synthase catalytic subunit
MNAIGPSWRIRVQAEAFDIAAETARLAAGRIDIGGVASFLGVVRGEHQGQAITAMTLEHYPGMTERALSRIGNQAASRWPLLGCTMIHRVGRLLPGDPIVLVLTASPHRAAALEACAFLIDWLKTNAPFWKHEEFSDGTAQWVEARAADSTAAARWG